MMGPGKYDAECTAARESAQAVAAVLIIAGGKKGSGFSVQAPQEMAFDLPSILREMADQIQRDLQFRF